MRLLRLLDRKSKVNYKEIYDTGAIIIDVRTKGEFSHGNVKGSVNVPLDKINDRINDIKGKNKPVIAVCKSGMRSGQAASVLMRNGVEAYNGGSWTSLDSKLS
ncbi:rhodanese-like domain-containing protein [Flavobacteriales bacterium]|nr:rhodanese-like domain-containing protein [Flavobacteriales bacterium]